MNDITFALRPRLIPLNYGGWLAVTSSDSTLRIGVIGDTEYEACAKFTAAVKRWKEILETECKQDAL